MKILAEHVKNLRYQYKVFLAMLVVSAVPLFLCALVFYSDSERFVYTNIELSKEAQLRQINQELDSRIELYEHVIDYMLSIEDLQNVLAFDGRNLYEVYRACRDTVDPLLQANMYYHPMIQNMTIYLKNSDIEHGETIAPFYQLEKETWYQECFDGKEPEETWHVSVDDCLVYYVRPVTRYMEMKAVLVTSFDYATFFERLDGVVTVPGESVSLLENSGRILYSSDKERIGEKYGQPEKESQDAAIVSEIEYTGWTLISNLPKYAISDALLDTLKSSSLILILCLAYAVVMSALLAKLLVKRIGQLTKAVSQIGANEYKGRTVLEQYNGAMDEIGALVENIHRMVLRLDELKIAVYNEKIARRDLEMKALQAQINPHFLYNSLSIINWKALDAGADEVSSITLRLAEFYRTTLNRGSSIITVEGELRNIRAYLDIQLIMHDYCFKVAWDLDEQIMNWQMPKLVLQPLVENALEHGLDLKEEGDKLLSLYAGKEGDAMVLIVRDNGVGMTQEKADALVQYNSKGYGIKNVVERITLLYGKNYVFRVTSREGIGTEIYIKIPEERSVGLCAMTEK